MLRRRSVGGMEGRALYVAQRPAVSSAMAWAAGQGGRKSTRRAMLVQTSSTSVAVCVACGGMHKSIRPL